MAFVNATSDNELLAERAVAEDIRALTCWSLAVSATLAPNEDVVDDGFARRPPIPSLDHVPYPLTDATEVLSELAQRLHEAGGQVHLVPFGWRKGWEVDPREYEGSQRVVDLAIGEEPVVWSTADVGGWSSRCGLLFRP